MRSPFNGLSLYYKGKHLIGHFFSLALLCDLLFALLSISCNPLASGWSLMRHALPLIINYGNSEAIQGKYPVNASLWPDDSTYAIRYVTTTLMSLIVMLFSFELFSTNNFSPLSSTTSTNTCVANRPGSAESRLTGARLPSITASSCAM